MYMRASHTCIHSSIWVSRLPQERLRFAIITGGKRDGSWASTLNGVLCSAAVKGHGEKGADEGRSSDASRATISRVSLLVEKEGLAVSVNVGGQRAVVTSNNLLEIYRCSVVESVRI